MNNVGQHYERQILTINDVFEAFGGFSGTIYIFLALIEWFFGAPFKTLDLAVSYQRLKEIHSNIVTADERAKSAQYADRIGLSFYLKYYFIKTWPFCFNFCCSKEAKVSPRVGSDAASANMEDPTFDQMNDYYDDITDQIDYVLSLKNLARLGGVRKRG